MVGGVLHDLEPVLDFICDNDVHDHHCDKSGEPDFEVGNCRKLEISGFGGFKENQHGENNLEDPDGYHPAGVASSVLSELDSDFLELFLSFREFFLLIVFVVTGF